jgi:hypothetical protein
MKKRGLGFLLLMSAALLGAQTALIREINGTVEVKTPEALEWQAAKAGQVLDKASLISTGFRSTALVGIGNSTIVVRPLTRLSLEEIASAREGEQVSLNLRAGRVRADVKPPAEGKIEFTIRSPIATASVRGTIFEFDGVRLIVEEGLVYFAGTNAGGVYIQQGREAAAAEGEKGKIHIPIETIKEEMSPALPAGVDANSTVISPGPSSANLDLWFDWSGQ